MSGTSMDGVDAAAVLTDGEGVLEFVASGFSGLAPATVDALTAVMADWSAHRPPVDEAARKTLATAAEGVLMDHAHAIIEAIGRNGNLPIELIGFHGQTVAHAPDEGWTWQVGDGAALARLVQRPVVWDFRTADMEAGGEGAPLAPFFHFALARHIGATEPLAFLNIGGVGNVTWIDPAKQLPEEPGALIAFDTGPGNALVNDWMQAATGTGFDQDGRAAGEGRVVAERLTSNAAQHFLDRVPPKSLDRNEFAGVLRGMEGLSVADGAATLTAFTADCVAASLDHMPSPPTRWLICGGGRRNLTMMRMLAERLGAPVEPVEAVGLDGDMLEAQAFAYLAVRVARGLPTSAPSTTGCSEPVSGGQISAP
ncbi:anhydro-N-acetylmuramic acid kinase [Rhodobacteraceae bacterium NNCM2]|nr:anhydro-N-acetylmuramic acid kinase [Coraliihabitans acroporae]